MSGFVNKAKGRIKQAVGSLTGDEHLKQQGAADERQGKVEGAVADVKGAVADVKHAVKGAVQDAKHALKEVTK